MSVESVRLILGSASPRRLELLAQIGITPVVIPADIDESTIRSTDPGTLVELLANAKHDAVIKRIRTTDPTLLTDHWILTADTVVVLDDDVLEKPVDETEATRMMERLSGRTHRVITGITVSGPGGPRTTHREITAVTFVELAPVEIAWYVATGEWHDVSGGYRIQGRGARYIASINGSHSNVVGLPLHLVYSILRG